MDSELQKIIEATIKDGLSIGIFIAFIAGLFGAAIGSYVSAYLKKAGEQRRIAEKFDEVLRQLESQTQITETIKFNFTHEAEHIKHELMLTAEGLRNMEVLKSSAYVDFINATAGLAISQKMQDKNKELEAAVLMADAKVRIAVYGSPLVAAATANFFRKHGALTSPDSRKSFVKIVSSMRADSAGKEYSIPNIDIGQLIFSEDIE